jgi:hypothetical protein
MAYLRWVHLFQRIRHRLCYEWHQCEAGPRIVSLTLLFAAIRRSTEQISWRSNALAGVGFVAPLVLVMTMVQLSTPPLFIGVASALTISARTLGGTVGYAIAEVIYNNISDDKIPGYIGKSPEQPFCYNDELGLTKRTDRSFSICCDSSGFQPKQSGPLDRCFAFAWVDILDPRNHTTNPGRGDGRYGIGSSVCFQDHLVRLPSCQ